jgi:tRNA dimethylallyltransferase
VRSTRRTLADWQQDRAGGIGDRVQLVPAILIPDSAWLAERIDARFLAMLDQGAVEEVDALVARDLDPALPAMRAIGVPEIAGWRAGLIDRDAAVTRAQAASRQYAKRQRTWLRHQPPEDWPQISQAYTHEERENVISLLSDGLTR